MSPRIQTPNPSVTLQETGIAEAIDGGAYDSERSKIHALDRATGGRRSRRS
jgi:hypothetical protein